MKPSSFLPWSLLPWSLTSTTDINAYLNEGDGILLKPKKPFPETILNEVAGCLKYHGTPKSLEDMDEAIRQGIEEL